METQRVFVENLHKPRRWWQEWMPLIIACIAVVTSICSTHWSKEATDLARQATDLARQATDLARQDIIASYRPYVYVSNRKDGKGAMDVKSLVLHCLNAPATMIKQECSYVIVKTKEDGKEEVTETIPWTFLATSQILYPSEKTTHQIFYPYDFEKKILEEDLKVKLRRTVRIDYKGLSTDRAYYFEGSWTYNRQYNIWETENVFGN